MEYDVTTADSGDAGIDVVRESRFGVALIDLKMPGRDGIETLREIRRIDPLCLIIIMTGYPTIDSSIEALRAGAYDYIIKPFKLGELREVVERAVKEFRLKVEIDQIQRKIESVEGELRDYRTSAHRTDTENSQSCPAHKGAFPSGSSRRVQRASSAVPKIRAFSPLAQ